MRYMNSRNSSSESLSSIDICFVVYHITFALIINERKNIYFHQIIRGSDFMHCIVYVELNVLNIDVSFLYFRNLVAQTSLQKTHLYHIFHSLIHTKGYSRYTQYIYIMYYHIVFVKIIHEFHIVHLTINLHINYILC